MIESKIDWGFNTQFPRRTRTERSDPSEPCTEIVRGQLASMYYRQLPQDPERPRQLRQTQCSSVLHKLRVQSQYPPPPAKPANYNKYQRPYTIPYHVYRIVPSFSFVFHSFSLALRSFHLRIWLFACLFHYFLFCFAFVSFRFPFGYVLFFSADTTIIAPKNWKSGQEKSGEFKFVVVVAAGRKQILILVAVFQYSKSNYS